MALNRVLTVSQLNDYIAGIMGHDPILRNVRLRGEISNMRITAAGHAYFSLKDEEALVSCVCFASAGEGLSFSPRDGDHVTAQGYVSLYAKSGQMQFYVQDMEQEGLGQLFMRFEAMKQSLQEQGYFDPERKKAIPAYPRCIGVVTSPTGAVLQDIRNVAWRRNPGQRLLLCPAKVQGTEAAEEIARGIALLNAIDEVDVIVLARGGGALEDLWAFNEMPVIEAIFASEKPVVSGVGHETDFTLADFVADLRAPTPSAAAELTAPQMQSARTQWWELRRRLFSAMEREMDKREREIDLLSRREGMDTARRQLDNACMSLDIAQERFDTWARVQMDRRTAKLSELAMRLELSGPHSLLQRGYAFVQRTDGQVVTDAKNLRLGEKIDIRFAQGSVQARVEEIQAEKGKQ